MTHAELFLEHPTPGFPAPRCTGELAREWVRSDLHHEARDPREHRVEKYTCARCREQIAFDATEGKVLNSYRATPVAQAARGRADAPEAREE